MYFHKLHAVSDHCLKTWDSNTGAYLHVWPVLCIFTNYSLYYCMKPGIWTQGPTSHSWSVWCIAQAIGCSFPRSPLIDGATRMRTTRWRVRVSIECVCDILRQANAFKHCSRMITYVLYNIYKTTDARLNYFFQSE